MPFDPKGFHVPNVTVLPPTPPEPGGGPRQVRIQIEIVDKRQQSPRGYRFGKLALLLLAFAIMLALVGCGPTPAQLAQQRQAAAQAAAEYAAKQAQADALDQALIERENALRRTVHNQAVAQFQAQHPGAPQQEVVSRWQVAQGQRIYDCQTTRMLTIYRTTCY